MTLANTKQVRKIVGDTLGIKMDWTDKSVNPDIRLVAGHFSFGTQDEVNKVIKALRDQGFSNQVKKTGSNGYCYLRVRASFVD